MKVKIPYEGVILIRGENQYELASSFMRLQEFYESPLSGVRGKFFTLEEYMDKYAAEYGNFTYTKDWTGFNVPGNVVENFFKLFPKKTLLKKELALRDLIFNEVDRSKSYYVIGTFTDGAVLNHELSHAFYYLDRKYRTKANELVTKFPAKLVETLHTHLLDQGYCKQVLQDETFAYLSTSGIVEIVDMLETENLPWKQIFKIQKFAADVRKQKRLTRGH